LLCETWPAVLRSALARQYLAVLALHFHRLAGHRLGKRPGNPTFLKAPFSASVLV